MDTMNIIGPALNFIGSLLIVFYIRTDRKEYIENEEDQKPGVKWFSLYVVHPHWLYVGVAFITIGFALSLIAEIGN